MVNSKDFYTFKFIENTNGSSAIGDSKIPKTIVLHKHDIMLYNGNRLCKVSMNDDYVKQGFEFRKYLVTLKGIYVTMINVNTNVMKSFNLDEIVAVKKNSDWEFVK